MALTELAPITVDRRFAGPPDSGHGGYVGGLLANHLGDSVEVTLTRPTPLQRPLRLRADAHRSELELLDGDLLVASARAVQLELGALPAATFEQAVAASQRTLVTVDNHRFPYCFACGPLRDHGDGLRLLAGPLQHERSEGRAPFATPWRPHECFVESDGLIGAEFVWAALDCPGWQCLCVPGAEGLLQDELVLLGRFSVQIHARPRADDRCVITAVMTRRDGRKRQADVALYGDDGDLLAAGTQTWIEVRPDAWPTP